MKRHPLRTRPAAWLLLLAPVLFPPVAAAQELINLTLSGTIDTVDDDFGGTGLQPGDFFTVFWDGIDPATPATDAEPDFVSVDPEFSAPQLSVEDQDGFRTDFFFDFGSIFLSNVFSMIDLSSGGVGFFGDSIELSLEGPESFLSVEFFNFSFDEPFDGPGGADPSLPGDLDTVDEPLRFLSLLDTNQPDPIGNGQGDFSSEAVAFSFFIDDVEVEGLDDGGDLPGDYDFDGDVDAADYRIWRSDFGSTVLANADGNRDGVVDVADYTIWRDNLGATRSPEAAPTPEPAAWFLVASLSAFLLGRRPSR